MSLGADLLSLPQWLAIGLLVMVAVSFSILGFLVIHRYIPVKVRQIHNDVAGFVFATLGVTYGVLLAFVVIVVWEQLNDAKLNVENESSIAVLLYHDVVSFPDEPFSDAMLTAFAQYARLSNEEQTPATLERSPDGSEAAIDRLLALVRNFVPHGEHERILYGQILENLNDLARYRNLRLQSAREELPGAIWIGVVAGAMITIGFTFLFGTENLWAHLTIMSLLSTLIAVVIYVVIELDHPSLGSVSIGAPDSYARILELANAKL
jgi:hypothetical protein